jgi:hypothetical protein
MPPRVEPEPAHAPEPRVTAQYATPATDQNLAEMAQRLEAALRRPAPVEPRLDVVPAAEPPSIRPAITPEHDVQAEEAAHSTAPEVRPDRPGDPKKFYESLEQEMASLLGRPTGKT